MTIQNVLLEGRDLAFPCHRRTVAHHHSKRLGRPVLEAP